jgi:ubiquinone/menaquinone biosynthesis C-methylase UbiE
MTASVDNQRAWTSYWQSGFLHSLPGTYDGNYGGSIGRYWRHFFSGLAEPCHVLDLATGNGPLPHCLLQVNQLEGVQCTAVDLSAIAPAWWAAEIPAHRNRVRFVGKVDLGQLPFEGAHFDVIVSQYGLEYGPRPQTLNELARVLRRDGEIRAICHHYRSMLLQQAHHERAHIAWILKDSGWFEAAAAMLEPMHLAATEQGRAVMASSTRFDAIRKRYDEVLKNADSRVRQSVCPDILGEAGDAFAHCLRQSMSGGVQEGLYALDQYKFGLRMNDQRLAHMQACALDEPAIKAMLEGLARLGIPTVAAELLDMKGLMGWCLEGKKTGA